MLDFDEMALVEEVFFSIPCYRAREELHALIDVVRALPKNPKLLIIGPGLGVETVLLKRYLKECEIEVVDIWDEQLHYKTYFKYNTYLKEKYADQFIYNCREMFEENCLKYANFLPIINQVDIFKFNIDKNYDFIYWDQGYISQHQNVDIVSKFNDFYDHLLDNGILFGTDYFYLHDPKVNVLANTQLSFVVNEFSDAKNLKLFYDRKRYHGYWYVKKNIFK